ncbi:MAG: FeoB-associated Cys-rich membrane protein [Bacilli bacterium]
METIIISIVIGLIICLAVYKIYKEKKNGAKCVGCPVAKSCGQPKNNL